jgi:Matrixin
VFKSGKLGLCVFVLLLAVMPVAANAKDRGRHIGKPRIIPVGKERVRYDDLPPAGGEEITAQFVNPCPSGARSRVKAYKWTSSTLDMVGDTERQAVLYGMNMWANVTSIGFTSTTFGVSAADTIAVGWAVGEHGDGVPFDGVGGTLAHSFIPCGSSWDGDVHFDDAETWTDEFRTSYANPTDLVTVAAHEVGHAIGLGHSTDETSLMYPTYTGSHRYLSWDDIIGVQSLYSRQRGFFHLRESNTSGPPFRSFRFGNLGDRPVAGDWNGDWVDTIGIWRPSTSTFVLADDFMEGSTTTNTYTVQYGATGDKPVVGDWDGDRKTSIGVYRPSEQRFYLENSLTQSTPDYVFAFGNAGDVPVAGDWNGDGVESVGLYRPSDGTFHLKNTNAAGPENYTPSFPFSGGEPVVGDWNKDGIDTVGLYFPASGTFYLQDSNTTNVISQTFTYGSAGGLVAGNALPVAGKWGGTGPTKIGIYQN